MGTLVFYLDGQLLNIRKFESYHLVKIMFSVIVVCWSGYFLDLWKRREKMFAIRFGGEGIDTNLKKGEGTGDETRRPGFRGVYRRALWNNDMNHRDFENRKRIKPLLMSCLISFFLLCVSMGFTLLILYAKSNLYTKYSPLKNYPFANFLLTLLPPVLNFAGAKYLTVIHTKVAIKRTYKENWDTVENFEKSLVLKTFFFNFLNLFNSFFIIGVLKPLYLYNLNNWGSFGSELFGQCMSFNSILDEDAQSSTRVMATANGMSRFLQSGVTLTNPDDYGNSQNLECYGELLVQVRVFFLAIFATIFFEILVPIVKGWFNNRRRAKHISLKKGYVWELIDKQIEDQFHLFPYQTTVEIDGVYGEYMEIVLLFAFLSCFGNVFPLGK